MTIHIHLFCKCLSNVCSMPNTVLVMGDGPMKTGNKKMVIHHGAFTDGIYVTGRMRKVYNQIISKQNLINIYLLDLGLPWYSWTPK